MNYDIGASVVGGLFGYYSGRFEALPILDDLEDYFDEHRSLEGLIVDVHRGRDMTLLGFTNRSMHGPMLIKRYPIDPPSERSPSFFEALSKVIAAAVLEVRAVPDSMLIRIYHADNSVTEWETASEDMLGRVIDGGLLAKRCTFCYGGGEFSLFYGDQGIKGYAFKPPFYINNIFHFPTRDRNDFKPG